MTPPLNPINRKAQSAPVITRNLRYLTTNATVVLQPAFRDPDEIFDQYVDQIHKRLAQSKQAKPAKNSKEEVKTMEVESESTFQKAGVPVATVDESIDELEHQAETVVEARPITINLAICINQLSFRMD